MCIRDRGSERRETVRSISGAGARRLRGFLPSTRGPGGTHRWCTCYRANGKRRVAKCGVDNRWKHLSGKPTSRWVFSWSYPVRSRAEHPLIGVKWKSWEGWSWGVLIDRGLDLYWLMVIDDLILCSLQGFLHSYSFSVVSKDTVAPPRFHPELQRATWFFWDDK